MNNFNNPSSELKEVIEILDKKLKGNDINIVYDILEYNIYEDWDRCEECDNCDTYKEEEQNCGCGIKCWDCIKKDCCMECMGYFCRDCNECDITQCYKCDKLYCDGCLDNYDIIKNNHDKNCDFCGKEWCKWCNVYYENQERKHKNPMKECLYCELTYCCKDMYREKYYNEEDFIMCRDNCYTKYEILMELCCNNCRGNLSGKQFRKYKLCDDCDYLREHIEEVVDNRINN